MFSKSKNKNRGSAYLLVISVVAILALIGSVFLFTAMDDRRDSDARLEAAPERTVAAQMVMWVQDALLEDMKLGPNPNWRSYIDYPSADPADFYDSYLASTERPLANGWNVMAGCWPKISNIGGFAYKPSTPAEQALLARLFLTNVNPAWEYIPAEKDSGMANKDFEAYFNLFSGIDTNWTAPIPSSLLTGLTGAEWDMVETCAITDTNADGIPDGIALIDTDGDGVRDAILFPTDSYSGTGVQFYSAIRVVDTSAFVNINTANTQAGLVPEWMTVGMIDPRLLPVTWPSLETGAYTVSDWPWWDFYAGPSHPDGLFNATPYDEKYAAGYAWLDRLDDTGSPIMLDYFAALDEGLPRSTGIPGQAFPDTLGRGVTSATDYLDTSGGTDFYHGYVIRPGNPDPNAMADYTPFDVADEIALRWLDTANFKRTDDYMDWAGRLPTDNSSVFQMGAGQLKSSRIQRLLEDSVMLDPDIPASEKWLYWAYNARYLTTLSSSRELARYRPFEPTAAFSGGGFTLAEEKDEWKSLPYKVDVNMDVSSRPAKIRAFNEFRQAFAWSLGLDEALDASEREAIYEKAAFLALNLIDYRDDDNVISYLDLDVQGSTGTTPTPLPGEGCIVTGSGLYPCRGFERAPVFVYAWSVIADVYDTPGPPITYKTLEDRVLLVLYNPFESAISLDDYELHWGSSFFKFDPVDNWVIPARSYFIIGSHPDTHFNLATGYSTTDGNFVEVSGLDAEDEISLWAPALDLTTNTNYILPVSYLRWEPKEVSNGTFDLISNVRGIADQERAVYSEMSRSRGRYLRSIAVWEGYQDVAFPPVATGEVGTIPMEGTANNFLSGSDPDITLPGDDILMDTVFPGTSVFDGYPQSPIYNRGYEEGITKVPGVLVNLAELDRLFYFTGNYTVLDLEGKGALDNLIALSLPANPGSHDWAYHHLDAGTFRNLDISIDLLQLPEMPDYSRLSNYFTVNSPLNDGIDNDGDGFTDPTGPLDSRHMRELTVHGRININTAPVAVLATIPSLHGATEADWLEVAGNLVGYRDRMETIPGTNSDDFSTNRNSVSSSDLRQEPGFASAGEVAAIMRKLYNDPNPDRDTYLPAYTVDENGNYDASKDDDGYPRDGSMDDDITKYDMAWAYLSNVLTVNSDTFCAYIWVQEGPALRAEGRRYIAILDRSNCAQPGDKPQIRAFYEVPNH